MVPHLATALNGPLLELERRLLESSPSIEGWLRRHWQQHEPPFYASVDLRNSGFKLAPVDTNLFPGGFNNLGPAFTPLAVQAARGAMERLCPEAKNLLLIPENHTRNRGYQENVGALAEILRQAGLEVRVAPLPLLKREGARVTVEDFDPCAILVNNDLSAGIPQVLEGLKEQSVLPPLHAGWAIRRKSQHFAAYDEVAGEFAQLLGIDPWLVNPYHASCGRIDFQARAGEECLASNVATLLERIRAKYLEYGVKETPYVVVKADAGTYGMGIMMVRDPAEVKDLNRKQRNKMAVVKEGLEVEQVILQEGVHTLERLQEKAAEPVVYMIDRHVIGGFYRVHAARGADENLNAPGMEFAPFDSEFPTYSVIARLAAAAAALELERTAPR